MMLAILLLADISHDRAELDPTTLRQVREFQMDGALQATQAHIGEDGTWVSAYGGKGLMVFNALTGKQISEIEIVGTPSHDGAISPDGRLFALAYEDQNVGIFELQTGKRLDTFKVDSAYC